jgi:small GTP-binding protein
MRYTDNTFTDIHLSTVGIDYKLKSIALDNGENIKVQIWDTAGQDRYKSITKSYIKGANGIILIYDVTKRKTFEGIQNWVKQIKEQVSSRVCVALVANKIDEKDKREVTEQEGIRLGKDIGYPFYESSAKDGINIDECFDNLIKQIIINYSDMSENNNTKLEVNKKNDSKGCC